MNYGLCVVALHLVLIFAVWPFGQVLMPYISFCATEFKIWTLYLFNTSDFNERRWTMDYELLQLVFLFSGLRTINCGLCALTLHQVLMYGLWTINYVLLQYSWFLITEYEQRTLYSCSTFDIGTTGYEPWSSHSYSLSDLALQAMSFGMCALAVLLSLSYSLCFVNRALRQYISFQTTDCSL